MILLTGLGNPGVAYEETRHNVGFMVLEAVRREFGFPNFTSKFKGLTSKGKVGGVDVVLLEPQTFMNLSGQSVQAAAAFYKIEFKDILVVHDELDLELGQLRWKLGGGDAGHNGLKSITNLLGTADYQRLRFGIDRPVHKGQVSSYVLETFSENEREIVDKRIGRIVEALPELLREPLKTLAKLNNPAAG
jgi:peptidyl-tRNA hydrolase, PTH1 family